MATVNQGTRAAELARQRAAEEARRKAAEEAKRKAAEEARRKAAEEAKKKAAEAAKKKAAEEAKKQAAEKAKLQEAAKQRMGGYTKPLQEPGQGKGTGPLNQAGKAVTKVLEKNVEVANKAGAKAAEVTKKTETKAAQTADKVSDKASELAEKNGESLTKSIDKRINLSESRVSDAESKFSTVLSKTLPGKILKTPENFKGVVTKGKEAFQKAKEGDLVGSAQALKEAKGSFDAGKAGLDAASLVAGKVKQAVSGGPSVFKNVAEGIKDGGKALVNDAKTVVKEEFKDTIDLVKGGVKNNAKAITDYAAEKGGKGMVKSALKSDTAAKAASEGVEKAVKTATKVLGTEVAEKAAASAATKTAAKVAGKAAGRFVPGVNVAIAAVDTKHAVDVLRDPKASAWKKTMASVTAVGSLAAATNIPVVSQIGAAVSVVGSVAEAIKPESIAKGAKAVADGAKKFFSGLFGG